MVKTNEPAFEIAVDSDDGDSGGPYFEIVSGDAYIGGIHAWQGTVGEDYARGTSIEHIEDHFGISV